MAKPFQGAINLDIRDSTPDWHAFLPDRAPEGAPNVLVVLYDDTGCAAWSPYGGRIEMPTLQRLADDGLTYSQWHTTALCSPTRSVLPHRPQPPPERLRLDLGDRDRLPRLQLAHPARERLDGDGAARRRLEHVLGRQEPQHAGRRVDDGLVEEGLAARPRLRPLLRLRRRRDEPVVSRPRRGQPLHRASRTGPRTATTCRRTSPTRRSSSSATRSSPSPTSPGTCGSARAPTTRRTTRRRSTSTSTRAKFDDGYEAYREWVLPRMIERGHPAGGHRAHADQPDDAGHASARATPCGRGTR